LPSGAFHQHLRPGTERREYREITHPASASERRERHGDEHKQIGEEQQRFEWSHLTRRKCPSFSLCNCLPFRFTSDQTAQYESEETTSPPPTVPKERQLIQFIEF